MIFFAIIFIVIILICLIIYAKRDPITRKKIKKSCEFSKSFVEPNETFELRTKIDNLSSHAMRRVYISHVLDNAIELVNEPKYKCQDLGENRKRITARTHVKAKTTRQTSVNLKIDRRGIYGAHELSLDYVDTMGFYATYDTETLKNKIIVAPKHVDDDFISTLITSGYGDFNAKRGFIMDEMAISTYDEYTGHEPMRQISWKKTAQAGSLMVKKFEPMGAHVTTIVFDVNGFQKVKFGDKNYNLIEYSISMLREIFEHFENKRITYTLYTNAHSNFIENNTFTSTPAGKATRLRMLNALGELSYTDKSCSRISSEKLLDFAIKNSYKGPFVYVCPLNRSRINYSLKKLSKSKGMEIIELYAENFYKHKPEK